MAEQPGLMELMAPSIGMLEALLADLADSLADECALSNDIADTSEGVARMICGVYASAQMVEYPEKPSYKILDCVQSPQRRKRQEKQSRRGGSRIKPPTKLLIKKR